MSEKPDDDATAVDLWHRALDYQLQAFYAEKGDHEAEKLAGEWADGKISLVINREVVNVYDRTVPPGQGLS